jgi:hypothetical protein
MICQEWANHSLRKRKTPLYEGTGFPHAVQGKTGENDGESAFSIKWFTFIALQWKNLTKSGTRRLV